MTNKINVEEYKKMTLIHLKELENVVNYNLEYAM